MDCVAFGPSLLIVYDSIIYIRLVHTEKGLYPIITFFYHEVTFSHGAHNMLFIPRDKICTSVQLVAIMPWIPLHAMLGCILPVGPGRLCSNSCLFCFSFIHQFSTYFSFYSTYFAFQLTHFSLNIVVAT